MMSQTTPDNFLGLPPEASDPATAKYAVLPVPYDATASFLKGTADGPRAIITASQQVELYDEELDGEFYTAGVATMDAVDLDGASPEEMHERVFTAPGSPLIAGNSSSASAASTASPAGSSGRH